MINSYGQNGKPFIVNLLETTKKNLTFPFMVGAYGLIDNYSCSNKEYVRIVFHDLTRITDYELIFDSCEELQTETIGIQKEVDAAYIKAGNFDHIINGSPMKYNVDIFGKPLTPENLYNRYHECFKENKYSRINDQWGFFTKTEVENIQKAYNL